MHSASVARWHSCTRRYRPPQPRMNPPNTTLARPSHIKQWANNVAAVTPASPKGMTSTKLKTRLDTPLATMNHWSCSKWPSTAR